METFMPIFFRETTISVRKVTLKTKNANELVVKRMGQMGWFRQRNNTGKFVLTTEWGRVKWLWL